MGVYQECKGCGLHQKTWDDYCESCGEEHEIETLKQRIAELEEQVRAERRRHEHLRHVTGPATACCAYGAVQWRLKT